MRTFLRHPGVFRMPVPPAFQTNKLWENQHDKWMLSSGWQFVNMIAEILSIQQVDTVRVSVIDTVCVSVIETEHVFCSK